MDIIERMDPQGFTAYLKQYGNTICGRHPIGVFLNMVAEIRPSLTNGHTMDLKFLKYAQSSQVSHRACLLGKTMSQSFNNEVGSSISKHQSKYYRN